MSGKAIAVAIALLTLLHSSCGGGSAPARSSTARFVSGGSAAADVLYRPNVVVVEHDEGRRALVAGTPDGSTLVFDSSDPRWRSLTAGQVLVIKGLLAKKILAVEIDGSEVGILTEAAGLTDIAERAHITLAAPIRFTEQVAKHRPGPWPALVSLLSAQVHAQGLKNDLQTIRDRAYERAKGDWAVSFTALPAKGRLNLALHVAKKVPGFHIELRGDGYLADFDLSSGIDIERGAIERLEVAHKKLNGVMNFSWVVGKESPGPLNLDERIKLPAPIKIPLHHFLAGFPLSLEVGGAVIVRPAMTGGKEYSSGAFRITYDGYQSFKAKEGTIDADGKVEGTVEVLKAQAISTTAPLGMVVALAAPRIELTTGVGAVLKFEDVKAAAAKADKYADRLITKVFGRDAYERFRSAPGLAISPSRAVTAALGSDAMGYVELVTTSGLSASGMSAFTPCTRTDLQFIVRVGASANAFGTQVAKVSEELLRKSVSYVNPKGTKLCDGIDSGDTGTTTQ